MVLLQWWLFFSSFYLSFCSNSTYEDSTYLNDTNSHLFSKRRTGLFRNNVSRNKRLNTKGAGDNDKEDTSKGRSYKCNGFRELCDLDITQITLAGSHNSGAGAYGWMKHQTKVAQSLASNCFYRNQRKSFYEQLEMGLRYFDIDACWVESHEPTGVWVCNGPAYAGSVRVMFQQIEDWMNEPQNRNEVIVIHFTRDYEKKNKDLISTDLHRILLLLWEPNESRLANKDLTLATSLNKKLRDAIDTNQRIYFIMHQMLILRDQPWLIPHWVVGYTWTNKKFVGSKGCHSLMRDVSGTRCKREAARTFLRYDLYLSSGLCVYDLAKYCRKYIKYGVHKCFEGAWTRQSTVNFIVVDFADDAVVKAAKCQNFRNIQHFLGIKSAEYRNADLIDCY